VTFVPFAPWRIRLLRSQKKIISDLYVLGV
jgi:hypothetical protein